MRQEFIFGSMFEVRAGLHSSSGFGLGAWRPGGVELAKDLEMQMAEKLCSCRR